MNDDKNRLMDPVENLDTAKLTEATKGHAQGHSAMSGEGHHYTRRERRELARMMGLKRIKESQKIRNERRHRAIQAGRQIHQQFVMQVENDCRNQDADREGRVYQSFVAAFGEKVAQEKMKNNFELQQNRHKDLYERRKRNQTTISEQEA